MATVFNMAMVDNMAMLINGGWGCQIQPRLPRGWRKSLQPGTSVGERFHASPSEHSDRGVRGRKIQNQAELAEPTGRPVKPN